MAENKDIKKQEAEFAIRQKEQEQRIYIDSLLRIYQDVKPIEKTEVTTIAVNIKKDVIGRLVSMINIIEREDWFSVHIHDVFPDIDVRMLANGCPTFFDCPFLNAVLRKIGMSHSDYNSYKIRTGQMILMEHKRKMGKKR